jgi:beta-galactosidase/beta-glucuronidase
LEIKPVQTLGGAWQVQFDQKMNGPAQPVNFSQLTDWSKNANAAISHYSGTAEYRQTFKWKPAKGPQQRTYLDLGQVANLAEIQLNGQPICIAWTAPYRLDVTDALKKGDNQLRILVTNTWANRLIGDQALPTEQRQTWTPAPSPAAGKPLLPAGLLGPVTIGIGSTPTFPFKVD